MNQESTLMIMHLNRRHDIHAVDLAETTLRHRLGPSVLVLLSPVREGLDVLRCIDALRCLDVLRCPERATHQSETFHNHTVAADCLLVYLPRM